MSRGKKLDIFIGADFDDDWKEVESKKSKPKQTIIEPSKHQLFFSKEKRAGKTITIVGDFYLLDKDAKVLFKTLKKKLCCGGSYKENKMEFQGDIKDRLKEILLQHNFKFKPKH